MPLDPQAENVLRLIRESGNPEIWQMTPAQARTFFDAKSPILDCRPEPVRSSEDLRISGPGGDIRVRVITPRESSAAMPMLVWYHGGGHVIGSIESYDALCRQLALRADCIVASVDYRLAPEHKFPAAVDDAFAALRYLAAHAAALGADPLRIAVGGDSAGGNLATVSAILARDANGPPLVFQLLVYPATASNPSAPSHSEFAEGYMLTRRGIDWFNNHYLRDPSDRLDFRYAPLACADLSRLPPALVIAADYDPLRDDDIAYAGRLRRAGNEVALVNYEGMIHGFFSMSAAIAVGDQAIDLAANALRRAFGEDR
jgi:acetyl esterase